MRLEWAHEQVEAADRHARVPEREHELVQAALATASASPPRRARPARTPTCSQATRSACSSSLVASAYADAGARAISSLPSRPTRPALAQDRIAVAHTLELADLVA